MPGMDRAEPERTLTSSGSLRVAEFLAGKLLEPREILVHLGAKLRRILLFVLQIVVAAFRADGEAGRHWKADARHLGKPRALAAQNFFHLAVAFGLTRAKEVDVFHFVFCPLDADLLLFHLSWRDFGNAPSWAQNAIEGDQVFVAMNQQVVINKSVDQLQSSNIPILREVCPND